MQAIGLPQWHMGYIRKQNRLTKYDYSQSGYYFVTVCTDNRIEFFGSIEGQKMILNNLGIIAEQFWKEIPNHYNNTELDEFVIMPNHMHGILVIKPDVSLGLAGLPTRKQADGLPYSLSQIIGSYKNVVTKLARQPNPVFSWQPSFYDHVIRKEESLDKIREYILSNPLKWELDRNSPSNLWM